MNPEKIELPSEVQDLISMNDADMRDAFEKLDRSGRGALIRQIRDSMHDAMTIARERQSEDKETAEVDSFPIREMVEIMGGQKVFDQIDKLTQLFSEIGARD
jgi:hypothetical protein